MQEMQSKRKAKVHAKKRVF